MHCEETMHSSFEPVLTPVPPRRTRAESSRINGAKSRGPVTTSGKRRSSRNSLKHGLAANCFLILEGEDPRSYSALSNSIHRQLRPIDATEEQLALIVVNCIWRQRRIERIEQDNEQMARFGKTLYRYEVSLRAQYRKAMDALAAHRESATLRRSRRRPDLVAPLLAA